MIARYCDICGQSLEGKNFRMTKEKHDRFLEDHRDGYFPIEYQQAVEDREGKLIRFNYAAGFCICPNCMDVANDAIWKAFEPIIKNRKKNTTIKTEKFPREPIREEPCCSDPHCDPF